VTIQGHRILDEVDWKVRSLIWVLIPEGCKLGMGILTLCTSSLLDITGQFWPKTLCRIRTWGGGGGTKGPTTVTTAAYP
jgi:hypothetical protein